MLDDVGRLPCSSKKNSAIETAPRVQFGVFGQGKGKPNKDALDKQLEEYMGPDAMKLVLDNELDTYFSKIATNGDSGAASRGTHWPLEGPPCLCRTLQKYVENISKYI